LWKIASHSGKQQKKKTKKNSGERNKLSISVPRKSGGARQKIIEEMKKQEVSQRRQSPLIPESHPELDSKDPARQPKKKSIPEGVKRKKRKMERKSIGKGWHEGSA